MDNLLAVMESAIVIHVTWVMCEEVKQKKSSKMDNLLAVMESAMEEIKQHIQSAWDEDLSDTVRNVEALYQCAILVESVIPGDVLLNQLLALRDAVTMEDDTRKEHSSISRGRPRMLITEDHLQFYLQHNFKVKDIATMVGCSKRTIERRMATWA